MNSNSEIIRIGITGHRFITDPAKLCGSLETVFQFLKGKFPGCKFELYSGLAEGADRLAARVFLAHQASLTAVIPLPLDEYQKDFTFLESINELQSLLQKAEKTVILSDTVNRKEAYVGLGRFLLQKSDILLSFWDGQASISRGSTGYISTSAIEQKLPVIWIHTENRNPKKTHAIPMQQEQGHIDYLNFQR